MRPQHLCPVVCDAAELTLGKACGRLGLREGDCLHHVAGVTPWLQEEALIFENVHQRHGGSKSSSQGSQAVRKIGCIRAMC